MTVTSDYPATRCEETVDTLAGIGFPDPYRWLEDGTSPEVRAWQREQNAYTSAYLARLPDSQALHALVDRFTVSRFGSVPRYAGGRWFRKESPSKDVNHPPLVVSDNPTGPGRVLYDPDQTPGEHPKNIEWISPSPDGRRVAFGVTTGGSENNRLHIIDVASGQELPDRIPETIMDSWTGGAQWLPDSSGFYYLALDDPAGAFRQAIFFHRIGEPAPERPEITPDPSVTGGYGLVQIDPAGKYAVALMNLMATRPEYVRDLSGGPWRPFVQNVAATVVGVIAGGRYIAVTDLDAPRGRLVAISLDGPTPDDSSTWEEVLPESDAVIRTVRLVGGRLFVTEFVDTYARVRILDLTGALLGEVPLPGQGALSELPFPLMNAVPSGHPDEYVFAFSTLTSSWGTYRYHAGDASLEELVAPAATVQDTVVEDRWAMSPDGARVPYHVVRKQDLDVSVPLPTLIYAYGGFNAPFTPQFPNAIAAFVEAGGTFVHCHLRGGSELGRDWWYGGRMRNKLNCYRDLYAIAEDLIRRGETDPRKLAVTGGSNGGLMAGVAVTQRPDLWGAVVPQVPFMDVIGGCRESYGRQTIIAEFGNPEDPDDVRHLASFSPYHLVRDGGRYPGVFITAGDTDPRCPPWHARKFAARMQAANTSGTPILLRVWEDTGHGWSTGRQDAVTQASEWVAFVLAQLGMDVQ
jgi:prolyl oligopeptidase